MDFNFENNTIKIIIQNKTFHLHPIWLRERLPGEKYFDLDTNQRLYEPSSIDLKLKIISCKLSDHKLDVEFNDGAQGQYHLDELEGDVEFYYDKINQLESVGKYKMGLKDSIWIFFDEMGDTLDVYDYRRD